MAAILMYIGEDITPITVLPNEYGIKEITAAICKEMESWLCPPHGPITVKLDPSYDDPEVYYVEDAHGEDYDSNGRYSVQHTTVELVP